MDDNKPKINTGGELKTLRTYMTDMADSVRANEVSVIKVALAEQNKKETEELYKKVEGTPTKKIFWFIGGLILIGVAIYGSYYLLQLKAKINTIEKVVKVESLISSDEISGIVLADNDQLIEKIQNVEQEKSSSSVNGSIKFIPISKMVNGVEESLSTVDIFSRLKFTAPSSLVRSLSDSYMIGTYNKDSTSKLFFIFQSKDYEYSYAGMLEWENTLENDMTDLFGLNNTDLGEVSMDGDKWKDIIINNRDARVLVDVKGRPILYYIFIDKESILIADSDIVIKELIGRLLTKK